MPWSAVAASIMRCAGVLAAAVLLALASGSFAQDSPLSISCHQPSNGIPVVCNLTDGNLTDPNNYAKCPQPACSCKQTLSPAVSSTVEFVNRGIVLPSEPGTRPKDCPADFHYCVPRRVSSAKRSQVLKCNDDAFGPFQVCAIYAPANLTVTFTYYNENTDRCTNIPFNSHKIASVALSSPGVAPAANTNPIDPVCSYYNISYNQYYTTIYNKTKFFNNRFTTQVPGQNLANLALPLDNSWPVSRGYVNTNNLAGTAAGEITVGACVKACNCLLPRPATFPHYWCVKPNQTRYEPVADGKIPDFPAMALPDEGTFIERFKDGPAGPGSCNRQLKTTYTKQFVGLNNIIIHKGPLISLPNQPEEYPALNTPAPGQVVPANELPTYDLSEPGYYTMEVVIPCGGTRNIHQALIYAKQSEAEACPLPEGTDTKVRCEFAFDSSNPSLVVPMSCQPGAASAAAADVAGVAGRKLRSGVAM